jgi:hypothetical protein
MRSIKPKNLTRAFGRELFKPGPRRSQPRTAYIHQDGHVVVLLEYWDRLLDKHVTFARIGKLPERVGCHIKGRIVVHGFQGLALFRAALECGLQSVSASVPRVEQGSEKTREKGIPIGTVCFHTCVGELYEFSTPYLSGGFTYDEYQQGLVGEWDASLKEWGGHPVVGVVDSSAAGRGQL